MDKEKLQLLKSIKKALWIGFIPFIVFTLSYISNIDLSYFGILSRNTSGLWGIILGPLIHGSWQHLFSNLPPLLFSVFLIHFFYKKNFTGIFISNYILTGIMVWIFSREVYHIGISGVVYALISFIFWSGIFVRNFTSIVLALVVLVLYSGMFAGIIPSPDILARNISWESHLLGGLVGIATAWMFRPAIQRDFKKRTTPVSYPEDEPRYPYFKEDTFYKTKWERHLENQQNQFKDSESESDRNRFY